MAVEEGLSPQMFEIRKKAFFLMARLKGAGHTSVEIEFDGSGDEGSIQEVYVDGDSTDPELEEELRDWGYELLDATGVDWYNNAGGYGTINWNVEKQQYSFTVHQREETAYVAASDVVKFGDQEFIEEKEDVDAGVC